MKITSSKGELFRLSFRGYDVILYSKFPYKFRKVVYPNGKVQMAAGAFSWNRSPSERRTAHGTYEEIQRRYRAEGADGVVDGSSDNVIPPPPVDERQIPGVSA